MFLAKMMTLVLGSLVSFAATQASAAPSKEPCGIAPTFTTCSVTIEEMTLESSASSCDSPIPELKQKLADAQLPLHPGLMAECSVEQFGELRNYSVPL